MQRSELRTVLTGTIGSVIEWAEYAFYGYMAIPIAQQFFPSHNQTANLIAAFAVFAAGFIMRPLGAVLLGHVGDRIGRKRALLWSMMLMGVATLMIGCLPTFEQIGLLAPIALLICRLLQGLAVSSECLAAAIFLIEHADKRRQTLAGSWSGFAAALGMTLGGIAAAIVTHPDMPTWAWRMPFFVGALGCLVALYLRQKVEESPAFLKAKADNALSGLPIRDMWFGYWPSLLCVAAFAVFTGSMIYVGNMYYVTFMTEYGGFSMHVSTRVTTFGEALTVCLFPFVAWYADKTSGLAIMRCGVIFVVFTAPVMFILAATGKLSHVIFAQVLYAIGDALVTAPMFKYLYDQFPLRIRVTGIAVSWNIAIALFAGTAPMIVQYFVSQKGILYAPGWYISLSALMLGVVLMRQPLSAVSTSQITPTSSA